MTHSYDRLRTALADRYIPVTTTGDAWGVELSPDGAVEVALGMFAGVLAAVPSVVLAMLLAVWIECRNHGAVAYA